MEPLGVVAIDGELLAARDGPCPAVTREPHDDPRQPPERFDEPDRPRAGAVGALQDPRVAVGDALEARRDDAVQLPRAAWSSGVRQSPPSATDESSRPKLEQEVKSPSCTLKNQTSSSSTAALGASRPNVRRTGDGGRTIRRLPPSPPPGARNGARRAAARVEVRPLRVAQRSSERRVVGAGASSRDPSPACRRPACASSGRRAAAMSARSSATAACSTSPGLGRSALPLHGRAGARPTLVSPPNSGGASRASAARRSRGRRPRDAPGAELAQPPGDP